MRPAFALWITVSACAADDDRAGKDPRASAFDGSWDGECAGTEAFFYPSNSNSYYTEPLDLEGTLSLKEAAPGVIDGEFSYTTWGDTTTTVAWPQEGVVVLMGTRDGPRVLLDVLNLPSTPPRPPVLSVSLDLNLVRGVSATVDTLQGELVLNAEDGAGEPVVPCYFARVCPGGWTGDGAAPC